MNRFLLPHVLVPCSGAPEVKSTAFLAHPPNLPPVPLLDMGFVVLRQLARHRRPPIRFLSIGSRVYSTLPSDPTSRSAPLRFSSRLPPSGLAGDSHPQAVDHARHTKKTGGIPPPVQPSL